MSTTRSNPGTRPAGSDPPAGDEAPARRTEAPGADPPEASASGPGAAGTTWIAQGAGGAHGTGGTVTGSHAAIPRAATAGTAGPAAPTGTVHGSHAAAPADAPPGADTAASPLLLWIGVLTCLATAAPMLWWLLRDPSRLARPTSIAWVLALAAFVALLWAPGADRCGRPRAVAWLVLHSLLALALLYLMPNGVFGVFLVIVAAGVGQSLPLRPTLGWIGLQTLAAVPAFGQLGDWMDIVVMAGAFGGFQAFAAFAAHTAERERRGREELIRVNAELTATRARLAETSRTAERLRIARDLHDVMGHHLTALSLQLEAARHAAPEAAPRHVEVAREVTATLLREVRGVVGRMREEGAAEDPWTGTARARNPAATGPAAAAGGVPGAADLGGPHGSSSHRDDHGHPDLGATLARMAGAVERPRVHLAVDEAARRPADPAHREALVRCAQEMITNAVRHSGADHLWLELRRRDGGYSLQARDDGHGAARQAVRAEGEEGAPPDDQGGLALRERDDGDGAGRAVRAEGERGDTVDGQGGLALRARGRGNEAARSESEGRGTTGDRGGFELRGGDDGHGAVRQAVPAEAERHGTTDARGGHGLLGMRERVQRLGGRLEVAAEPGRGFTVGVWLPVEVGALRGEAATPTRAASAAPSPGIATAEDR